MSNIACGTRDNKKGFIGPFIVTNGQDGLKIWVLVFQGHEASVGVIVAVSCPSQGSKVLAVFWGKIVPGHGDNQSAVSSAGSYLSGADIYVVYLTKFYLIYHKDP